MAKNAASEKKLGALHNAMTSIFTRILEGYEKKYDAMDAIQKEAVGDELVSELMEMAFEPNPVMLAAIAKFLKDNEITYDSEELDELGALERKLAERKANRPDLTNVTNLPLTSTA